MQRLIYVLCVMASMAHALDSEQSPDSAGSVVRGNCRIATGQIGDALPDGVYQGQCINGKAHGKGEVVFNNGDRLQGEFRNGRIDGEGTWISGSSGNSYTGSWRDGKRDGEGTYSWSHGAQQYVGEWAEDKREGHGTFTWANGDRFEGEFRNNQQYTGRYTSATGKVHTCYMGLCR